MVLWNTGPMRALRILAVVVLIGAAFWFDTKHANRWLSTFLIVGGVNLVILGEAWFEPDRAKPSSPRPRYRYRVAAALLTALAAAWLSADGRLATSAVTTWIVLLLLTYQAPWLPRNTREYSPPSSP